jgi:hypothetical protein
VRHTRVFAPQIRGARTPACRLDTRVETSINNLRTSPQNYIASGTHACADAGPEGLPHMVLRTRDFVLLRATPPLRPGSVPSPDRKGGVVERHQTSRSRHYTPRQAKPSRVMRKRAFHGRNSVRFSGTFQSVPHFPRGPVGFLLRADYQSSDWRRALSASVAKSFNSWKNSGVWPMKSPSLVRALAAPIAIPLVSVGRIIEQRGKLRFRNGHGSGMIRLACNVSGWLKWRSKNVTSELFTGS